MTEESIVYGYIKTSNNSDADLHYQSNFANRKALMELPTVDSGTILTREMFSIPHLINYDDGPLPTIVHFAHAYNGIEYEWGLWMQRFEQVLQKMHWDTVIVHLETELSGTHTFTWDSGSRDHIPSDSPLNIRCEWQHELGLYRA